MHMHILKQQLKRSEELPQATDGASRRHIRPP